MRFFSSTIYQSLSETQGRSVGPEEKVRQKFSSTISPGPTDRPWVSENANTVSLNTQVKAVCNEV